MPSTQSQKDPLFSIFPRRGRVEWIALRPAKRAPMQPVDQVEVNEDEGLVGDHFAGGPGHKRQVTLIQREHLDVMAAMLGTGTIDAERTRRNIVVSGINLTALKDHEFQIGTAVMLATGPCHPCSRMEENLGSGGYNAMRGHGGITATVTKAGIIRLGDEVQLATEEVS